MGKKQLYNDNLRKLRNEYGDVSVVSCVTTGGNDLIEANIFFHDLYEDMILS